MSTRSSGMPADVKHTFDLLSTDVKLLHVHWILYKQLYATNERRVELLNRTASLCFSQIQQVLADEVVLAICRLTTDPVGKGSQENLVLRKLRCLLDPSKDATLIQDLDGRMKSLPLIVDPLKTSRDKRIAHRDRRVAEFSLPDLPLSNIEDALAAIRDFLNAVELHFDASTSAYEYITLNSDGEALIKVLKQAIELQNLVKSRAVPRNWQAHSEFRDA